MHSNHLRVACGEVHHDDSLRTTDEIFGINGQDGITATVEIVGVSQASITSPEGAHYGSIMIDSTMGDGSGSKVVVGAGLPGAERYRGWYVIGIESTNGYLDLEYQVLHPYTTTPSLASVLKYWSESSTTLTLRQLALMRKGCSNNLGAMIECDDVLPSGYDPYSIAPGEVGRMEVASTSLNIQCAAMGFDGETLTEDQMVELQTAIQEFPLSGALDDFNATIDVISNWTDNALLTVSTTPSVSGEVRCAFRVLQGSRRLQEGRRLNEDAAYSDGLDAPRRSLSSNATHFSDTTFSRFGNRKLAARRLPGMAYDVPKIPYLAVYGSDWSQKVIGGVATTIQGPLAYNCLDAIGDCEAIFTHEFSPCTIDALRPHCARTCGLCTDRPSFDIASDTFEVACGLVTTDGATGEQRFGQVSYETDIAPVAKNLEARVSLTGTMNDCGPSVVLNLQTYPSTAPASCFLTESDSDDLQTALDYLATTSASGSGGNLTYHTLLPALGQTTIPVSGASKRYVVLNTAYDFNVDNLGGDLVPGAPLVAGQRYNAFCFLETSNSYEMSWEAVLDFSRTTGPLTAAASVQCKVARMASSITPESGFEESIPSPVPIADPDIFDNIVDEQPGLARQLEEDWDQAVAHADVPFGEAKTKRSLRKLRKRLATKSARDVYS